MTCPNWECITEQKATQFNFQPKNENNLDKMITFLEPSCAINRFPVGFEKVSSQSLNTLEGFIESLSCIDPGFFPINLARTFEISGACGSL